MVAAGAAVELVHMATLVHDDMLDGADLRRGRPTAWALYGEQAAKAAGDYLFARAFARARRHGDAAAVALLAEAALALARGEALQRRQAFRPDTTVDDYLVRCSLKTGKLFEAACLLGRRPAASSATFGLALGIAFQIADDILDCTGDFDTTGKVAGVDLRDGTPTLPLILAAREDDAGLATRSPASGSRTRSTRRRATGALERVARGLALEYARQRARAALDGEADRDALEALTYAVVRPGALTHGMADLPPAASRRSTRSGRRSRRTSASISRTGSR